MLRYYKLWDILNRKNMTKTELALQAGFSKVTLTKLIKGEQVQTDIICKICKFLNVQPCDIMEYVEA
ncbi:MAG: helix-turn-helix domain-containing protein [Sphaerochaeta sp.]